MNIPSNLFHEKELILFASKTTEVQIKYKQKGIPQKKNLKKMPFQHTLILQFGVQKPACT